MRSWKSSTQGLTNVENANYLHLVKWSGYEDTDEETSWLPASELRHALEIISDFHDAYPDKPGPYHSLFNSHLKDFFLCFSVQAKIHFFVQF